MLADFLAFFVVFSLGFVYGVFLGTKARDELRTEIDLLHQRIRNMSADDSA